MQASITFGIMIAMLLAFLSIAITSVVITICVVKDIKFWHDRELMDDSVEKCNEANE